MFFCFFGCLYHPSKFGKFSLKIGGEIICQSWSLFNLFSQLTHCALLQLFSQVIQKVIFTKYLNSDGNHNIRSKIKILFLESLLLSLDPCHICFVICFHIHFISYSFDKEVPLVCKDQSSICNCTNRPIHQTLNSRQIIKRLSLMEKDNAAA